MADVDAVANTFAEIANRAMDAVSVATTTYGPDAVALGLAVYRVHAANVITVGILCVITAVVIAIAVYKFSKYINDNGVEEEGVVIIIFFGGFVAVAIGVLGILRLLNIYYWVALFGYPELLVARDALAAAGLLR